MEKGFHNTIAISLAHLLEQLDDFAEFAKENDHNDAYQFLAITADTPSAYDLIHALESHFKDKAAADPDMLYYPIAGLTNHEYKLKGDCGNGYVILQVDGRDAYYPAEDAQALLEQSPVHLIDNMKAALEGKRYGVALYTSELRPNVNHLLPLTADCDSLLKNWIVVGVLANDNEQFGDVFRKMKYPRAATILDIK